MARNTIDHNGPWKVGWTAVGFRIEIVSPSSDGLRQCNGRDGQIQSVEGSDFPDEAQDNCGAKTKQQTSVDCKASLADVDDFHQIAGIIAPVENYVIKPCSDNPHGDTDKNEIQDLVRLDSVAGSTFVCDEGCQNNSGGNQNAIPHDVDSENRKGNRIWYRHKSTLLTFPFEYVIVIIT